MKLLLDLFFEKNKNFGMKTKLDFFFGCALFIYNGPIFMVNVFFVVSVTDLGSMQQDVARVLVH
jgi:hypothetical protein